MREEVRGIIYSGLMEPLVFKMWSAVALVSLLVGLSLSRDVSNESSIDPAQTNNYSHSLSISEYNQTNKQSKYNRIFDFVKYNSNYRDNVMVISPPLKVTLNKSPQKNDSLFRVTRSLKGLSDSLKPGYNGFKKKLSSLESQARSANAESIDVKRFGILGILRRKQDLADLKPLPTISERKLDILRQSFDPLDSVIVISPPLKVTLNNSPQKNDSLFKISRKETESEKNESQGRDILQSSYGNNQVSSINNTENYERLLEPTTFREPQNKSSLRRKREATYDLSKNLTSPYSTQNQHYNSYSSQEMYQPARYYSDHQNIPSQVFQISPSTDETSRYIQRRWPRNYLSYMMIPALLFLGYAPLALWALKLLVYKGLFLSKLAFATAVYLGLRTLVFASPLTPTKYYNFGYENDRYYELTDTSWQTR